LPVLVSAVPPINLVGDFGGGDVLVTGARGAVGAVPVGPGPVIDAAMVDGSAYLMMLIYSLSAQGI
jgi:alpha-methylacyl-CoA racemase